MPLLILSCMLLMATVVNTFAQGGHQSKFSGRSRYFVENKGQWDDRVRYMSRGENLDTWFTEGAVYYDYYTVVDYDSNRVNEKIYEDPYEQFYSDSLVRYGHVVKMEFVQDTAQRAAKNRKERTVRSRVKNRGDVSFASEESGSNKYHHASTYKELLDDNVYKNTQIRYYFDDSKLRYDILVYPGGNPKDIRLKFDGVDSISVNEVGELVLHTSLGAITQGDLNAFQEVDRGGINSDQSHENTARDKDTVRASFTILNKSEVTFNIGKYDSRRLLIIDPIITATYLGGAAPEVCIDTDLDEYGNIYIVGSTESTSGFPITTGAYQTVHAGSEDIFVTKLNPAGDQMLWSTYVGGANDDRAYGVEVHSTSGGVAVVGYAGLGFPQVNALQASYGGDSSDGIVFMLNSTGGNMLFSSYLGSSGKDRIYSVHESSTSSSIILCGIAFGSDLATTPGVLQGSKSGGNYDAFVAKLNLAPLSWSYITYLGGNANDRPYMIKPLSSGRSAIVGFVNSTNYPTTTNAHQQSFGGDKDAFLTIVSANGSSLEYSTYIGSSGDDRAHAVHINNLEEIYLTGFTTSGNFPTTATAYDNTHNGAEDAFVLKLSTQSTFSHSTFFGDAGMQSGLDICQSISGGIMIIGQTYSLLIPTVGEALDPVDNGNMDVFIADFDQNLGNLQWSTFFGGGSDDNAQAVVVDEFGRIVIVGSTNSSDFPVLQAIDNTLN